MTTPAAWEGITIREKRFVELYAVNGNATQSYLDAGFKAKNRDVAGTLAARLLGKARVSAYLTYMKADAATKAQMALDQLVAKATDIALGPGLEAVVERKESGSLAIKKGADLSLLDSISYSESDGEKGASSSFSVKRMDRAKAIDVLTKLLGGKGESKRGGESGGQELDSKRILGALGRLRPGPKSEPERS